ncbi:hypothetical protein Hanom_Chr16g01522211 [Helianthus anomalus]
MCSYLNETFVGFVTSTAKYAFNTYMICSLSVCFLICRKHKVCEFHCGWCQRLPTFMNKEMADTINKAACRSSGLFEGLYKVLVCLWILFMLTHQG